LADIKSPEQSTENKDKASSTASHSETRQPNELQLIMITGVENHEDLTSIIGEECYQTKLTNNGITKIYQVITLIES
jgi:hypothetical protein